MSSGRARGNFWRGRGQRFRGQTRGRSQRGRGRLNNSLCLDTRRPGTVFKKLDTRQSEMLTNFLGIARLILLRTQDICLEISSDCKLKVEASFGIE